jgi:hypothetical protein
MNQLAMDFTSKRRSRVPYYATTPLTLNQLAGAIRIAEQQDEAVLAIFRALHAESLAPSQVWKTGTANGRQWLLTSVRRSITNLTNAGALVRASRMHEGPYGRLEHAWRLAA